VAEVDEMDKEKKAQSKKKEAGKSDKIAKLEDLISRLPKDVIAKDTSKGTVLRHGKTYFMHIKQSPRGILHFLRTKTGKHLDSRYASTEKELDVLLQEINDKIKSGGESKSTSPPLKGK
jgi:hypothetical protein